MANRYMYAEIEQAIDGFWRENHYPPTVRYLVKATNASSTSIVAYYLKRIKNIRISDGRIIPLWVDDVLENAQK